MASPFAIDTTLTPDYVAASAFSHANQNTCKNEIVSKFNAQLHLLTGHHHDGVDSNSLSGGNYSLAEIEAMIIMGVYK